MLDSEYFDKDRLFSIFFMNKKILGFLGFFFFYTVLWSQVQLPFTAHFRDANAKTTAQNLWKGPWDQSLRCDGLDSLRFLPTCCNKSENVPFMGMSPYDFYCEHRKTLSNGDYLSLIRNYNWGNKLYKVCDMLEMLGPKVYFSSDSLPVLALLCSKNNLKMTYKTWPGGTYGTMPERENYTALEVTLVDSLEQILGVVDTLEMTDGFTWQIADPAHLNHLNYRGIVRCKMRFLGNGNMGIDEVKMYRSPKVFSRIVPSCSGKDGRIVIDSVPGFASPLTYQWSNGSKLSYIDSLNAGSYSLMIQDASGKWAKRTFWVETRFQVAVDSVKSIDTSGLPGGVVLGYVGGKPKSWNWTSPLGFSASIEKPALYQPAQYLVKVTDSAGCFASAQVALGIRCEQVVTPPAWSDSICAGVSPIYKPRSPFPSLTARYWLSPNSTLFTEALSGAKVWQGLVQGWNTRYVRWVDTINGCVGGASPISVYVGVRPAAAGAVNWSECATNFGFTHTWPEKQLNRQLYWRRLEQTTWMNTGRPQLSPTETMALKGNYTWVGKYLDTNTGCFSDTILSVYRVLNQIEVDAVGIKWYAYGTTSTLEARGIPKGSSKTWTISYGAQFEMYGPGGSMHPCHNQTQCVSTDSILVVRHSTVPCWSPPRVIGSVELTNTSGMCQSNSKFTDYDTGYYDCFGTQLLAGDTVASAFEGETLKLGIPTSLGYHQIDDPLHMLYANCNFYLPHEWQIQYKDSAQWLSLKAVLDTAFSTQTDTNVIQLLIPNVSINMDQCKVRLRVERCEGVWSESNPQLVRIQKDAGDYVVFPNPTADELVIRPSTNHEVRIYNAYGRLQFTGRATETISTKTWDDGVYWVQLEKGNAVKTVAKLVVLH
jgi:hypothetical protein